MPEALGNWTITDIDLGRNYACVNLATHIDINLEEERENINEGENIKIPLLSPNTGKPFANLIILEEDGDIDFDFELIDEWEKFLYDKLYIESVDHFEDELSVTLLTTSCISNSFIIEKEDDHYRIRLQFPVCILPLYFKDIDDILNAIEESKNLESFHTFVHTSNLFSDLDWRDIPDGVFDEILDKQAEFFKKINQELFLEDVHIKLNKNGKIIKSGLILKTGGSTMVRFYGPINIYYDREKKYMVAELLVDKLIIFIYIDYDDIRIGTKDYNFITLDLLYKKNLLDRLIFKEEFDVPITDYNTALEFGLYIINWFSIIGEALLSRIE